MKASYLKITIILMVLSIFLADCGNCDDGVNYEDEVQQSGIDSVHVNN